MDLLLPVCISLAALGAVAALVLWLRGRRGRAVQAFGFAALPVGLYLTGLLGLVFDAASALGRWAAQLVFNPVVWAGVALLGVAVVLWVVGGMVARRTPGRRPRKQDAAEPDRGRRRSAPAVGKGTSAPAAPDGRARAGSSTDSEFDEIEELLRRRGIE